MIKELNEMPHGVIGFEQPASFGPRTIATSFCPH